MENLSTYAMLAQVFGGITIIFAAVFASIQFYEYKRKLRIEIAAEMCRRFAEPDLARAVTLVKRLPDDISLEALQSMDIEYEESAQIVGMAFETMGLLVHRRMASFDLIQELSGGLLLMMWRKTRSWLKETREAESNARFGEWVEWLAMQVELREQTMVPAYIAHAKWRV